MIRAATEEGRQALLLYLILSFLVAELLALISPHFRKWWRKRTAHDSRIISGYRRYRMDSYRMDPNVTTDGEPQPPEESAVDVALATTSPEFASSVVGLIREVQFDGAKEVVKKLIAVRDGSTDIAAQKRHDANIADAIAQLCTDRLNRLANGDVSVLKLRDQVNCPQCHMNYSEYTYAVCPGCGKDNAKK